MAKPNYESQWWGYIYDQMMEEQPDLVESHLRFYRSNLRDVAGGKVPSRHSDCYPGSANVLLR